MLGVSSLNTFRPITFGVVSAWPPPLHRPTFPDEFLAEARRLFDARTTASHFRQRARLVLLLHESPTLTNVAAAARLDLHPNSIRRWRQRWAGGQFTFEDDPGRGRKPVFSPLDRAVVASIACDVVARTGNPLSRQSTTDLADRARDELNKPISRSTVWRILDEDAIKPWQYEHSDFPRAPTSSRRPPSSSICTRATGKGNESIRSTGSSARTRRPASRPASAVIRASARPRVGAGESRRNTGVAGRCNTSRPGTCRKGAVMGLCEPKTGIEPFGRLVRQVMEQPVYGSADRVFWVVDNGSSHRGESSVKRMSQAYPNAILVHLPVHASWLNQVEVYFSLLQRKVLTPNDSIDLQELELRIRLYEELTNKQPKPFAWRFTKCDLFDLLQRLAKREAAARASQSAPWRAEYDPALGAATLPLFLKVTKVLARARRWGRAGLNPAPTCRQDPMAGRPRPPGTIPCPPPLRPRNPSEPS